MSSFQTQSQWENEIQPRQDNVLETTAKSGVAISRRILIISGLITAMVILCLLGLYIFGRPITGVWVRQADDTGVAGMTVKVERIDGVLQGTIIAMDEGVGVFEVGLVKWYDIRKVGFGKYTCYDLVGIGGSSTVYHYEGTRTTLTVSHNGSQLSVDNSGRSGRATGVFQIWVKAEKSNGISE